MSTAPATATTPDTTAILAEIDRRADALSVSATALGGTPRVLGEPSWTDAATPTRLGNAPAVCLGPTATRPDGSPTLHRIDEYIEVADLIDTAKAPAPAALSMTAPTQHPHPHPHA